MCENCGSQGEESLPDLPELDGAFEDATNGGVTSIDEVLDCLSDPIRRNTLYYCRQNEIATVEELAEHVAGWKNDISPHEVPDEQRKRYETQLVHTHLPKLVEANVLEYDRRSLTLRYEDPPRKVDWLLQALAKLEGWDRS